MKVAVAAIETYGRIGDEFVELLYNLHYMAQTNDVNRSQFPSNWFSKWKAMLGCAVARNVARSIDDAVGTQHLSH